MQRCKFIDAIKTYPVWKPAEVIKEQYVDSTS